MRKRISTHIMWVKYIYATIATASLYLFFRNIVKEQDVNSIITQTYLGISFITTISYHYFNNRKHLEYDGDFLYIIHKKETKRIPLNKVHKVRVTNITFNRNPTWKVDYYDFEGKKLNVRIIPNKKNKNHFEEFKIKVMEVNPDAVIEETPKSF